MLQATEAELAERLEEACSHVVQEETTAELVRLEETLSEAARVAKQAVSLRRRLRTGHGSAGASSGAPDGEGHRRADVSASSAERRSTRPDDRSDDLSGDEIAVREFLDQRGRTWRVWAVTQEQLHPGPALADQLGDYRDGWLTFECADGSERRRFPNYPPHWRKLTNLDLEGLLDRAEAVRRKRATGGDSETTVT